MDFVKNLLLITLSLIVTTSALKKCEIGSSWSTPMNADCNRYYHCSNGILLLKFCPPDQEYDGNLKMCRKPLVSGCFNSFSSESQTDARQQKAPFCPNNQTQTILYPHEIYCSKFYSCTNGILTIMNCVAGTEFIPEKGYCDWISDGGCSSGTTSVMQTTFTTSSSSVDYTTTGKPTSIETTSPYPETTMSYPETTTILYETTTILPETTTRLPETTPSWPETTTPYPETSSPYYDTTTSYPEITTERIICNDQTVIFVPHESDCTKYYFCLSGIPQQMQCAHGEEFDFNQQKCVKITEFGCLGTVTRLI